VPTVAQAAALFGRGSMLARMMALYRANDPFGEVWVVPIADPGAGTVLSIVVTITGTATAAGTISLYVGAQLVQVAIPSGTTAAAAGPLVASAVNAALDAPMTAAAASGVVTLTSRAKGTSQIGLDVRLNYYGAQGNESLPAGLTVAVGAATGGTGAPDVSGVAAALGDIDYDFVISGFNDAATLTSLQTTMSDSAGRWSWLSQNFGGVFTAKVDSAANLITFGATRNDQHQLVWGCAGLPNPVWEFAAAMTAACIPAIKADPARPLQTLAVNGLLAPAPIDRFPKTTQQTMLTSGIAQAKFDRAGNTSVLRAVTTYQLNKFGQPDQSYLDVETLFTLMAITRRLRNAVTQKFPRAKLADDGTRVGFGQPVVTPAIIKGELIAQYATMVLDGLVDSVDLFAAGLVVIRNSQDSSRVDVLFDPYLINGLRIFAVLNQFRL
jgi:phage tail sheath gpL-like